jgi:hypothetical protein
LSVADVRGGVPVIDRGAEPFEAPRVALWREVGVRDGVASGDQELADRGHVHATGAHEVNALRRDRVGLGASA